MIFDAFQGLIKPKIVLNLSVIIIIFPRFSNRAL